MRGSEEARASLTLLPNVLIVYLVINVSNQCSANFITTVAVYNDSTAL